MKDRGFYDAIILLSETNANIDFLFARYNVNLIGALITVVMIGLIEIDLELKNHDLIRLFSKKLITVG